MPPLSLSTTKPYQGSRKRSKRIGRGNASGKGNYSTKGIKGQKARQGGRKGLKRMSFKYILQRIPKNRGFHSLTPKPSTVSLDVLDSINDATITLSVLRKLRLVPRSAKAVKILGTGNIRRAIMVKECQVSASAVQKIQQAGGTVVL